jgi:hypothetical protein
MHDVTVKKFRGPELAVSASVTAVSGVTQIPLQQSKTLPSKHASILKIVQEMLERPEDLLTVSRTTQFLRVPGKSILDRRFGDEASTVQRVDG